MNVRTQGFPAKHCPSYHNVSWCYLFSLSMQYRSIPGLQPDVKGNIIRAGHFFTICLHVLVVLVLVINAYMPIVHYSSIFRVFFFLSFFLPASTFSLKANMQLVSLQRNSKPSVIKTSNVGKCQRLHVYLPLLQSTDLTFPLQ